MVADNTHKTIDSHCQVVIVVIDLCKETVENKQIVTPEDDHSPL